MNGDYGPIRSYQRIFTPDRRLYSIEGRVLPVPGGVPLRWLAYATGSLVAVIALSAGSQMVVIFAALIGALAGLSAGGRIAAVLAGLGALGAVEVGGWVLSNLDWPLRLIVVPVAVATLATQATPDGRRADRFALSWLALRLAPSRRSLDRELPVTDRARLNGAGLWVEADEHSPELRRARLRGPGQVSFASPVDVKRRRRRRYLARRLGWHLRSGAVLESIELGPGESLEVRP